MVMQDVNHQLFTESVLDEVLLSMDDENTDRAEEILTNLNLIHLKEVHPMALSGGEKQRVAIASAIASDKEFLIFDEPTSGLDLKNMMKVSENLVYLQKLGITSFIITHDFELIMEVCSHVLHMEDGKIIDNYKINEEKLGNFFLKIDLKHNTPIILFISSFLNRIKNFKLIFIKNFKSTKVFEKSIGVYPLNL